MLQEGEEGLGALTAALAQPAVEGIEEEAADDAGQRFVVSQATRAATAGATDRTGPCLTMFVEGQPSRSARRSIWPGCLQTQGQLQPLAVG
jgi:hypothetical protein